jgi:hypothetical protein
MRRPIGLVGTAIAGAYFDGDSPNITAAVAHSAHYGLAEFSSADGKPLHPPSISDSIRRAVSPMKPIHRRQKPPRTDDLLGYQSSGKCRSGRREAASQAGSLAA